MSEREREEPGASIGLLIMEIYGKKFSVFKDSTDHCNYFGFLIFDFYLSSVFFTSSAYEAK